MRRRLVTFIGTPYPGAYRPARYAWDDATADETRFVAEALCQLLDFGGDDEVCIACTDAAWDWRGEKGQESTGLGPRLVDQLTALGVPAHRVPRSLPSQAHDQALWEHFGVLREAITAPSAGGSTVDNGSVDEVIVDEVIVDVTHGFRATPVLAAAVLAHARIVPPGLPRDVRLVYGAFESPLPDDRKPIWDLTGLLMLNDWTRMLTHLLESGRVVDIDGLVRQVGGERYRRWISEGRPGPHPVLSALANALKRFGDDIATLRLVPPDRGGPGIIGAQGSAHALITAAQAAVRDLSAEMAPMADALESLVDRLTPLDCASPKADEGIDALRELARLYLEWDRLPEAATALREGMISARCNPEDRVPGGHGLRQRRERHSPRRAGALFQARNDILHAGFTEHRRKPDALRNAIRDSVHKLHPINTRDDQPDEGIFLNLSNHPSSGWSDQQRDAALALASPIVDHPFPAVPPTADEAEIARLAEQSIAALPDDISHAMVMGEMCTTMAVVQLLQEQGVVCLAATTHRGERPGEFRFVRWRAYPRIG